ncbi:glycoside hydrolase family 16 protein [Nocardioides stalactiti]|uniref:glycoside hydrolase family 16 protein n=1 Tax=Nocardioides stalactiti TaxID=2755356 RepID=UPI0015FFB06F|nr:glycoside hydrolase family 16 protein [Nocardioides stalactiti]
MPSLPSPGRRLLVVALAIGLLVVAAVATVQTRPDPADPFVVGPSDACGPVLAKPGGGTWECSFFDDFDGDDLDLTRWITQDTARTGFKSGLTCYRGASNVAVRSGTLLLEARDEGTILNCDNPYGSLRTPYTGGLVGTRTHFSQAYGRFEIRAKYPTARTPGVHGAFWLYPLRLSYGRWPASGEIDVAEWWSNDPTLVLPTLHYNGRNFHADSGWDCRVEDVSEFHTYAVEWFAKEMRFSIDGEMCWARRWAPDAPLVAPQPFDRPFSIILNMGVGTVDGTNPVSDATDLPATFVIDYARAWR